MNIAVGTWNAEWANSHTHTGPRIAEIIEKLNPDIFVLTEGSEDLLPKSGHVIDGGTDWGYKRNDQASRKVLAWSKHPWSRVDPIGHHELPPGRYISGTTQTVFGEINVIGVCVPWQGAHTTTGHKNRKPWEDHESYLTQLTKIIQSESAPLIVAGDFNQRIPRSRQPSRVYAALSESLRTLRVATIQDVEPPLIDHIAHSHHLASSSISIIANQDNLGRLSDHRGAVVDLELVQPIAMSRLI